MTDDIDPRDMIDEQALLPVEGTLSRFSGHCAVAPNPPGASTQIEIGFTLWRTIHVKPGIPVELRVVIPEANALSAARAILDVLQGLAHDRIVAMREDGPAKPRLPQLLRDYDEYDAYTEEPSR